LAPLKPCTLLLLRSSMSTAIRPRICQRARPGKTKRAREPEPRLGRLAHTEACTEPHKAAARPYPNQPPFPTDAVRLSHPPLKAWREKRVNLARASRARTTTVSQLSSEASQQTMASHSSARARVGATQTQSRIAAHRSAIARVSCTISDSRAFLALYQRTSRRRTTSHAAEQQRKLMNLACGGRHRRARACLPPR